MACAPAREVEPARAVRAWRFDPCELAPPGSAVPLPRAPWVDAEPDEEDFLDWEPHVACEDEDDSFIRRI